MGAPLAAAPGICIDGATGQEQHRSRDKSNHYPNLHTVQTLLSCPHGLAYSVVVPQTEADPASLPCRFTLQLQGKTLYNTTNTHFSPMEDSHGAAS